MMEGMRKGFIVTIFFLLPAFAYAEELLPAICQQVINPVANTSIPQIVINHIKEKLDTAPQELARDAKEVVDQAAESLASAVESRRPSAGAGVLGASTVYKPTLWESIYDKLLEALAFTLRHWTWALGAVTILIIGYSFRP
jgi:hypothetical protein